LRSHEANPETNFLLHVKINAGLGFTNSTRRNNLHNL